MSRFLHTYSADSKSDSGRVTLVLTLVLSGYSERIQWMFNKLLVEVASLAIRKSHRVSSVRIAVNSES